MDNKFDCFLAWRYGEMVIAGLPVYQTFEALPVVGDELKFIPVLLSLFGQGAETPQEEVLAKVILVEKRAKQHLVMLEVLYKNKKEEQVQL